MHNTITQRTAAAVLAGLAATGVSLVVAERRSVAAEPVQASQYHIPRESIAAWSDHALIAQAINRCGPQDRNPAALPLSPRDAASSCQIPNLIQTWWMDGTPEISAPRHPVHAAALSFSDRIARERVFQSELLESTSSLAWWYKVMVVVFGAAATMTVGARTMLDQKIGQRLLVALSIAAMVLSGIGTALTSLSGSDDRRSEALRAQRTLSQLQQLHWRIVSDVLGGTRFCLAYYRQDANKAGQRLVRSSPFDPADAKLVEDLVNAWKMRLEAILDTSVDTVARPGDLSQKPNEAEKKPDAKPAPKGGAPPEPPNQVPFNAGGKPVGPNRQAMGGR